MLEAKAKDQEHNFPTKNKTQAHLQKMFFTENVLRKMFSVLHKKDLQENSSGVLPQNKQKGLQNFFQAFSEKNK